MAIGFINTLKNNKTIVDTYNKVKNYLGITTSDKANILLSDSCNVPYTTDLIIYDENFNELMRLRGSKSFSLSANKSNSAVPSGKSITKGIVVGNHSIQISDADFCVKEEDLELQQKVQATTSKARAFVGLMSKQSNNLISKGTMKLASIYQYVNGVSDLVKQANDIQKQIRKINNIQQVQTKLENLLLNQDNGTFQITYCGKLYYNMACVDLQTSEDLGSLVGVSMKFEYCPTLKNASVKGVSVKGFNNHISETKAKVSGEIHSDKTWFKQIEDYIMSLWNKRS